MRALSFDDMMRVRGPGARISTERKLAAGLARLQNASAQRALCRVGPGSEAWANEKSSVMAENTAGT